MEGHIGHGSSSKLHRPHRVADDFRLLSDGHVVLIVWLPTEWPPCDLSPRRSKKNLARLKYFFSPVAS